MPPTVSRPRIQLPDGQRSRTSPYVWRALAFLALVGAGLCFALFETHRVVLGSAWVVITLGWASIAAWLWVHQQRRAS